MSAGAFLDLSPEVAAALREGRAVVALESTLIAHGLPWPDNAEIAARLEEAVRDAGAVPATVAVVDGRLKAGLDTAAIERLARGGPAVLKCSRRDLPLAIVQRALGATTVAATMIVARLAGIRVFATGGIGGVHRGAERTFDISADLQELARTEVAVVCAGAKSVLDLALTLEYLETHGVPVIVYRSSELPAFYTRDSGFAAPARLDEPQAIARALLAQWDLGLGGGAVIANPIPAPLAMARERSEAVIARALAEAAAQGVAGKAVTPFVLGRVAELSGGESLAANKALVLHNARLAAEIARALAHEIRTQE